LAFKLTRGMIDLQSATSFVLTQLAHRARIRHQRQQDCSTPEQAPCCNDTTSLPYLSQSVWTISNHCTRCFEWYELLLAVLRYLFKAIPDNYLDAEFTSVKVGGQCKCL
jgi:hypothetical protein